MQRRMSVDVDVAYCEMSSRIQIQWGLVIVDDASMENEVQMKAKPMVMIQMTMMDCGACVFVPCDQLIAMMSLSLQRLR